MGKQPKKKATSGNVNAVRSSGKAPKQNPGAVNHREKLSPLALILMNKGIFKQVSNRAGAEKLKAKASAQSTSKSRNRDD